ncbi:MAG: hypothetical protein Q8919_07150 [Bacteroidota bacterium]|nr:hypothetical protein [Bacteroidota bacterium]
MGALSHQEFVATLRTKDIDVFISCASFEDRYITVPQLATDFCPKERIFFFNANELPIISKNAEKLCGLNLQSSKRIALNSEDPLFTCDQFENFFYDMIQRYPDKKPNLLVECTTFTHEAILILLKLIDLKRNLLGNIYVSYVGAKEYSYNIRDNKDKWLSTGVKSIRTILGYSGYTDPMRKNHLIILFGFESERTKQIIDEYQYEYITLGFGSDSMQIEHQKINRERHQKLLLEYPNAKQFSFTLLDPIETKNQILQYLSTDNYRLMNNVIAPMNNKISTIGAGLAGIEDPNIQLAYAQANIYNIDGYASASDDLFLYEIRHD